MLRGFRPGALLLVALVFAPGAEPLWAASQANVAPVGKWVITRQAATRTEPAYCMGVNLSLEGGLISLLMADEPVVYLNYSDPGVTIKSADPATIRIQVDGGPPLDVEGFVQENVVTLPIRTAATLDLLKSGKIAKRTVQNGTFAFPLTDMGTALEAVHACAHGAG